MGYSDIETAEKTLTEKISIENISNTNTLVSDISYSELSQKKMPIGPRSLRGKNILVIGGAHILPNLEKTLQTYLGVNKCDQTGYCRNGTGQRRIQEKAKNADVLIVIKRYVNHNHEKMALSSGKNITCVILFDTNSVNFSAMDLVDFLYSPEIYTSLAYWSKQNGAASKFRPYKIKKTNRKLAYCN